MKYISLRELTEHFVPDKTRQTLCYFELLTGPKMPLFGRDVYRMYSIFSWDALTIVTQ